MHPVVLLLVEVSVNVFPESTKVPVIGEPPVGVSVILLPLMEYVKETEMGEPPMVAFSEPVFVPNTYLIQSVAVQLRL